MSLSEDIIAACADDETPLATILRKCLVFATQIKSEELKSWAHSELEGYRGDTELPPYRSLSITAKGTFFGSFGSVLNDQPLPSVVLKEPHRHWATATQIRQGIASLAALVANDTTGVAQVTWPADMVVYYQAKFYEHFALSRAWQEIPIPSIVEVLDTVRTKVLKFMLELQGELGDLNTIVASRKRVEEAAPVVHNVFQTTVYGGTAIVASTAGDVDARTQAVVEGDIDALKNALRAHGLDQREITELESAIDADTGADHIDEKSKVLAWIQRAAKKIGGAAGGVAIDAAKASLTSLVNSYLGLPPQ